MKRWLLATIILGCVSAAPGQADPKKKKSDVPQGLKALKHEDPLVRMRAADLLGRLGATSKFALPELHEALKDKDARVRVKVAEALWRIEKPPASVIVPVLQAALRDKNPQARALVPGVLAQMGNKAKSSLPALQI